MVLNYRELTNQYGLCRDLKSTIRIVQTNLIACTLSFYIVYVIELSRKVFTKSTKFREAKPQFHGVLECLYVGMTSKTPKERFEQHKTGYRNKKGNKLSSNIVQKYGRYLRPSLYNHIAPMKTSAEALKMEEKLALELRRKRYEVWFN